LNKGGIIFDGPFWSLNIPNAPLCNILDYITNETLRRRIHRALNKGEAMNGLARALFFGKRGEFRERGIQDQLQRASALNILINAQ
jgi:TnpA family transposase